MRTHERAIVSTSIYMSAMGQRVAKRIVDGAFPYDIPDKGGKMIYRKGKLQT